MDRRPQRGEFDLPALSTFVVCVCVSPNFVAQTQLNDRTGGILLHAEYLHDAKASKASTTWKLWRGILGQNFPMAVAYCLREVLFGEARLALGNKGVWFCSWPPGATSTILGAICKQSRFSLNETSREQREEVNYSVIITPTKSRYRSVHQPIQTSCDYQASGHNRAIYV